ncbi:MAG: hypothetical protein GXO89_17430 [Chlorobi bacterium]|nr:hypothetical protein [Chlorobiota bacterium]
MKTFYSIVSVILNAATSERLSLGLVLSNGNDSIFNYSRNRLSVIRPIISKAKYSFVKDYFKSMHRVIEKVDENLRELTIFNEKNLIFNEPYFEYLSDYNRNVVTVSKPIQIDVPVSEKAFRVLFIKFIEKDVVVTKKEKHNVQLTKERFLPGMKSYCSINKELTNIDYPALVLPITIDLIGKNERPFISQFFDLERGLYHIKNDYFDLNQIPKIIPDSKKFIISTEPDKNDFIRQHAIWEQIREIKGFTYVDVSEVEKIEEYAKTHGVTPLEN